MSLRILLFALLILITVPIGNAEAYVGPGAGITAIGALIAMVGAIFLVVVGFVWYPIKRLRAKYSVDKKTDQETTRS